MNRVKVTGQYVFFAVMAFAMLVASIIPAIASAAVITERSIEMTTSATSATSVSYTLNFKSVGAAGALVIEFCGDTPLIGEECTPPAGMVATGAATSSGFTVASATVNKIIITGTIGAASTIEVPITGITNPSAEGSFYARVLTYADGTAAAAYTSESIGASVDQGSLALATARTIGVSGDVLETMTFCVSGTAITTPCTTTTATSLVLGKDLGNDIIALATDEVSEGKIYTQISTNANKGAIVYLKSNATGCGGLMLRGAEPPNNCFIQPAQATGIAEGEAKFGVKTTAATATSGQTAIGTFAPTAWYADTLTDTYMLQYSAIAGTGVTSTYGDPFLTTGSLPAIHQNIELTFGASISSQTPAGSHSADLNLIATGTF